MTQPAVYIGVLPESRQCAAECTLDGATPRRDTPLRPILGIRTGGEIALALLSLYIHSMHTV